MLRWKCWNSIWLKQYVLLHTPLLTTSLPERVSSRSRCVWTLRLTRYHTLQSRLTYKQTSVAPHFKPPAWLFLSCLCTLTRILLLIFSVLPSPIHVLFKKKKMSSIRLSKQSCWSYHYVLGAAGFNSGSRPHRDNDVCFVCSVSPPFNTPHALFNGVLLSSVLTTSSPQPFRSSLNPFLWITDRVLFPPPPLHSTQVAGRNYCLFKYKLKCWPLHGVGFQ